MKKKMTLRYVLLTVTSIVLAITAFGAISLYRGYQSTLNNISVPKESEVKAQNPPEEVVEDSEIKEKETEKIKPTKITSEPFSLLLYGLDVRPGENSKHSRTDTIMVALVDPIEEKVSLISIPRDSYVRIPGYGKNKINSAFPRGGADLSIETINNWLGTDIYGHVAIDFEGFEDVIDLVGGLDVNVDRTLVHGGVRLEKGQQHLNGEEVLTFVRHRLDDRGTKYASSDYDRMERQQYVLKELTHELVSAKSIFKIFDMMNIVSDHIETSLTPEEMNSLIKTFMDFNATTNLQTTSIQGNSMRLNGVWFEDIPAGEVTRIQNHIQEFMNNNEE